jgi:hypothetical protein
MKTVYTNSLINLLEIKKSKLTINEFHDDFIVIDNKPIYFFQKDEEKYHFSVQKEKNSIYIEFRSSEINIDASEILGIASTTINYKTILPIVAPSDRENLKTLLIFLLTENTDKIKKEEFISSLVQIHRHPNISETGLKNLFENAIKYMEKYLKDKKSKISFTNEEIIIKYSLGDIDKITSSVKKELNKKDDIKLFEQI